MKLMRADALFARTHQVRSQKPLGHGSYKMNEIDPRTILFSIGCFCFVLAIGWLVITHLILKP